MDQAFKMWGPEAFTAGADMFLAGQRKMYEAAVQAYQASEVPTRKDVDRLTRQVELAEQRAQACEAALAAVEARLAGG